jgi:hypothetical protein
LISNITNNVTLSVDQTIDGTGDPAEVADRSVDAIRSWSQASLVKAGKTVKVLRAR